jgi:hypothetical protein
VHTCTRTHARTHARTHHHRVHNHVSTNPIPHKPHRMAALSSRRGVVCSIILLTMAGEMASSHRHTAQETNPTTTTISGVTLPPDESEATPCRLRLDTDSSSSPLRSTEGDIGREREPVRAEREPGRNRRHQSPLSKPVPAAEERPAAAISLSNSPRVHTSWVELGMHVFPVTDNRHVAAAVPPAKHPCGSCRFFVPGARKG